MEDYRNWLAKVRTNGVGGDRDAGEIDYLSDEEELNKTGGAPAILSDEEEDSFADSEVSSVESDCEADQMNETTDEKEESTVKNEFPPRNRARSVSETLCLWQCAVYGKKIKGTWQHRRQHIQSHETRYVACPIDNCTSKVPIQCILRHLKSRHNTTMKALSTVRKADVQAQIDRNMAIAIKYEMKYFPPSSLVSSSETTGRHPVNPHCKKCGSRVVELRRRRDHIAIHLSLKISCPIVGCSYTGRTQQYTQHFNKEHGIKYSELRMQENQKFGKARKEFNAKVALVMSQYFA
ncbi:hypothetical protein QR680_006920 [Steinernema hermaphroditum]|uniref:C2H2-type domain-containing protein n=1 Tax=Steinernema hermaphroditum TaxID=289476 RepID=A0AA39LXW3_9BILA|nr:hypothetical protein QR680_006920 [Steinernema hermaphroditum]